MKLALLSAFPQELKHIRKNLRAVKISTGGLCPIYLRRYLGCHIIAAHCGLGIENLESAFNYISKHYCPDVFVSLGFGGALYEGASIGDVVWASRYLLINGNDSNLKMISFVNHGYEKTGDDQILKKAWGKIAAREGTFVTLPKRISKKDLKNLIPSDILFPVCEQETFHLARLSQNNGIAFLAVRSITDRADEDIPAALFSVTDTSGQYRLSRALGVLMSKPALIPAALKVGRNAALASRNLWHAVRTLIEVLSSDSESGETAGRPTAWIKL